jgi:hypothetical protein
MCWALTLTLVLALASLVGVWGTLLEVFIGMLDWLDISMVG